MDTWFGHKGKVSYLDNILLDQRGLLKPLPHALLRQFPLEHLQAWANANGIFYFVTAEMIEWLKQKIENKKALEICAGDGCISRYLGIIGIDNRIQESKKFRELLLEKYGKMAENWESASPPREVKKYEALDAVRVFRPEIVIGAYVTQKGTLTDDYNGHKSFEWGVNERELLKKVKVYIHFGNKYTHSGKFIFDLPHQELHFPWLVSRAFDQSLNRVWIWENNI